MKSVRKLCSTMLEYKINIQIIVLYIQIRLHLTEYQHGKVIILFVTFEHRSLHNLSHLSTTCTDFPQQYTQRWVENSLPLDLLIADSSF